MSESRIQFATVQIGVGKTIQLSNHLPFGTVKFWQIQADPSSAIGSFLRIGDKGVSAINTGATIVPGQTFPPVITSPMDTHDIYIMNPNASIVQLNIMFQLL